MHIIIGHPFKKRDLLLVEKRFRVKDVQYFFEVLVVFFGYFSQDIAGDLSVIERHQDPAAHLSFGRQAFRHCIGKSPLGGNCNSYSEAG